MHVSSMDSASSFASSSKSSRSSSRNMLLKSHQRSSPTLSKQTSHRYTRSKCRPSSNIYLAIAILATLFAPSLMMVKGHTIDIAPSTTECFFEDLSTEDKMTVTYQVAAGGELDIDFWVTNPRGDSMYKLNKMDTGTYSFTAHLDGRYTYCFSNKMSSVTGKTVSFNVHGVMYVEDDGHTAPIEKEIRALSAALEAVKDEQEYIVTRERLHRDTAESTNDRVKWWSIIQTILLVAVCAWQVYYLRRTFEVKR